MKKLQLFIAGFTLAVSPYVSAQSTGLTELISVNSELEQGNGESAFPAINANGGRFVAYQSTATNLVEDLDTQGQQQIYVYDRVTGETEIVSTSQASQAGDGLSSNPNLSADGRYVVFWSVATNLVHGDTNGREDVFVHDRLTNETERVSVSTEGSQGEGIENHGILEGHGPAISADGRYAVFWSTAHNLVSDDDNESLDVFVRDRLRNTTVRVSVNELGEQSNGNSGAAWISGDGRFVGFHSAATNLVSDDTNGVPDVFVVSLDTGLVELISRSSTGELGNDRSLEPYFSHDGRFVAFGSWADNLVPNDNNESRDVFVYDRLTHHLERVSVDNEGNEFGTNTFEIALSADGRFAIMLASAENQPLGKGAVWLYDLERKEIEQINVDPEGNPGTGFFGTADPSIPSVSSDGRYVAFWSAGDTLVPGDSNHARDVFVRDRGEVSDDVDMTGSAHLILRLEEIEFMGRQLEDEKRLIYRLLREQSVIDYNCDYSYADQNNGWGWNSAEQVSCPRL